MCIALLSTHTAASFCCPTNVTAFRIGMNPLSFFRNCRNCENQDSLRASDISPLLNVYLCSDLNAVDSMVKKQLLHTNTLTQDMCPHTTVATIHHSCITMLALPSVSRSKEAGSMITIQSGKPYNRHSLGKPDTTASSTRSCA